MTVPTIPTEDDFVAMQDEALANNRANGLPAKAPTEIRRRMDDGTVMVFTTTSPAGAAAWVDDMLQELKLRWTDDEIDEFMADTQRDRRIIETYFPDEDQRLCDAITAARENARTIEL